MEKIEFKILALTLGIVIFVVYQSTISPVVYLGDSGELTAAAFSLVIPHGSGYPLYTLLGKLFCLIPIGNVGFRMNLMSVFFAMATLWLVYSLIVRITASQTAAFLGSPYFGVSIGVLVPNSRCRGLCPSRFFCSASCQDPMVVGREAGVSHSDSICVCNRDQLWQPPSDGHVGAGGLIHNPIRGQKDHIQP